MRQDKLTTKFQEALGEAQSLALAHDNQVIEPVHILAAVLADGEGSSRSLLERAGVNVQSLTREVNAAVERLPKVSGTGGDVQISRDLMNLLNLTEKEAMKRGGTLPGVMNAANEVAVDKFRRGEIRFPAIWRIIEKTMSAHEIEPQSDFQTIRVADAWARAYAAGLR